MRRDHVGRKIEEMIVQLLKRNSGSNRNHARKLDGISANSQAAVINAVLIRTQITEVGNVTESPQNHHRNDG